VVQRCDEVSLRCEEGGSSKDKSWAATVTKTNVDSKTGGKQHRHKLPEHSPVPGPVMKLKPKKVKTEGIDQKVNEFNKSELKLADKAVKKDEHNREVADEKVMAEKTVMAEQEKQANIGIRHNERKFENAEAVVHKDNQKEIHDEFKAQGAQMRIGTPGGLPAGEEDLGESSEMPRNAGIRSQMADVLSQMHDSDLGEAMGIRPIPKMQIPSLGEDIGIRSTIHNILTEEEQTIKKAGGHPAATKKKAGGAKKHKAAPHHKAKHSAKPKATKHGAKHKGAKKPAAAHKPHHAKPAPNLAAKKHKKTPVSNRHVYYVPDKSKSSPKKAQKEWSKDVMKFHSGAKKGALQRINHGLRL